MFDAIGSFFGAILTPLYWITSLVLSGFHSVFGAIFGDASGASWALSIVGLTLVVRASLIPLFVKQIKSSRNMQLIQPRVRELQKKYKHDRERLAQEQMKLYKDTNTNPFSACLPLLLQMPIFLALFHLIDSAANGEKKGVLTQKQVDQLSSAELFGARIADTFLGASGDAATQVKLLAAVLVVAMTATTFLTQRQLMTKNMPADALTGQYAQQQKLLLYVLPLVFAVGGIAFPIGVLLYWTTSNLWTMGQQFYVIRNNPVPGTPAAKAKEDRDAAKRRKKGLPDEPAAGTTLTATETPAPPAPPRQQPKKQTREQRRKQGPPRAPRQAAPRRPGPSEQKNPD
ncbi:membrane protein insertase YidC [Nocardioides sp. HDW12B]|uniref:membrane protein insertase YidC n=1 Tax=Nocardioides sp. HDW12B TaxID=2714939 RepID=UPI001F0D4932|nr:membrane protein insertase YidC [Nocardioides sp. HDW12B]